MSQMSICRGLMGLLVAGVLLPAAGVAGKPAVEGYADYDAFRLQLESIAASEFARLESLGTTLGSREVYLLKIGTGKLDEKPAILLVGSVEPAHLFASELTVGLARRLVDRAKADRKIRRMLDRVTFYVIPRPAPDASEAFFETPSSERKRNARPLDDDGDGRLDEDPPEDLNGDGVITVLRVADRSGPYIVHPDDNRILIEADADEHELGRWQVYSEGRDNDEDDALNEDPPGGVAFNRNFTFGYPYFEAGAGPHQVSEVETRAVADFAFDHANVAVVLTCTPEDNLMDPWESKDSDEQGRIKTRLLAADAPYVHHVAEAYREIHGGDDPPEPPEGEGSFSDWAYFHYGRWSFAFRGWWIPTVDAEDENAGDEDAGDGEDDAGEEDEDAGRESSPEKKKKEEKRGADDLNALRWFAREGIDGFVDWREIDHPDFPGRKTELGGFKPFVRLNPPIGELAPLVEKHGRFLEKLVELMPRPAIGSLEAEPLGGGVWRVTAEVVNEGFLPTMSQMGRTARKPHPMQIELELPEGVSLVGGSPRGQLPVLAGDGGRAEQAWLVVVDGAGPARLRVRAWSPSVGTASKVVDLVQGQE